MCNTCNSTPCSCSSECDTCVDNCPIKLDFECIIYNKFGTTTSNLTGMDLPNGTPLKLIIEVLDQKIQDLKMTNFSLSNLRQDYTINTLKQFSEAIDVELGNIRGSLFNINNNSAVQLIGVDSATIDFTTSGVLNHTITGNVKIGAPDSSNCLTIQPDGLVAVPQTISVDYTTKKLSISKGNTVNLSGLFTSTFLGSVATDPAGAIDGNYWYNTAQSKLKIKVNNTVKEILTA